MERIIASIPHTGTRFLSERLGVEYFHTTLPWEGIMEAVEGKEIIAPLRDPISCWASTVRRWLKPKDKVNLHNFIRAWYVMHALTLVREVNFIPVDLKPENKYGITDWTPIGGETGRDNKIAPDICLTMIYKLPFVKQFYSWNPDRWRTWVIKNKR